MIFKDHIKIQNGVFIASEPNNSFSDAYIKVRQKEGRIYTKEELTRLPDISPEHPHSGEWKLRQKSAKRFSNYLKKLNRNNYLLEIGCGNGWFTNLCARNVKAAVGIDVNLQELEQAANAFQSANVSFAYWDVFSENPFKEKFDIIVLNAVIQYFPDIKKLLTALNKYLNVGGEIHIIDSPFYNRDKIEAASMRTKAYYEKIGVPEMSDHYFHHSAHQIKNFEVLYQPSQNKLKRLIKGKDMPFGWYKKTAIVG